MRPFLVGTEFVIHTDHQPLIYLSNMKIIDSRLARTLEDLADFSFTIQYTPGKLNTAADALSRLYEPGSIHHEGDALQPGRLPAGLAILKEVPGGGDSLFQSLYLLGTRVEFRGPAWDSAGRLREVLVDDLLNRPDVYKISLTRNKRKQLKLMRLEGQLPCVEVLYAFGELFGCYISVHFGGVRPVNFVPPCRKRLDGDCQRIHLQCLGGVHYNPVMELKDYRCEDGALEMAPINSGGSTEENAILNDSSDSVNLDGIAEMSVAAQQPVGLHWCSAHVRSHSATLMVQVQQNSYCALLDSGSQITCVTESLCKQLQLEIDHTIHVSILGLGSAHCTMLGTVKLVIELPNGNSLPVIEAAVLQDQVMPYCIILGADFMTANAVTVDLAAHGWFYKGSVWIRFANIQIASVDDEPQLAVMSNYAHSGQVCALTWANNAEGPYEYEDLINDEVALITLEEIRKLQQRSSVIRKVKKQLEGDPAEAWPPAIGSYRRHRKGLMVNNGILFHQGVLRQVPVVTFNALVEVMLTAHVKVSHIGRQKLIELVRKQIWSPSIAKVARDITGSCSRCQHMKVASVITPPLRKVVTGFPFEMVTLDLVSLPKSASYSVCLVAVDHNSKWLSAVPLTSKTSEAVGVAMATHILPYLPSMPQKMLNRQWS